MSNIDDVFRAQGLEPPLVNVPPDPLTKIIKRGEARNKPIEDSHTNKQAMLIEKAMISLLVSTVNFVKEEYQDSPENYNDLTTKQNLESEVGDALRAATESFYGLASAYVNRANRTNAFLTTRDINNIKIIADDATIQTMIKFDDYFRRESQILNQTEYVKPLKDYMKAVGGELLTTGGSINVLKRLNSFQLDKNVKNIVINVSTRALAMGTVDKARQMLDSSAPSAVTSKFGGPSLEILMKNAAKLAELNLSTKQIWNAGYSPGEYVPRSAFFTKKGKLRERFALVRQRDDYARWGEWVTAGDDRVCLEYCLPLEGEVFDMMDELSPIPGSLERDTHPNCRCRYLLLDPVDVQMSNVIWG